MNELLSELSGRELQIIDRIRKKGPVTKSELLQKLNLKLTTLNRSMKLLEGKKLIVESGISESTGGRKPAEYDISEQVIYTVGVDISRTYVQIVLMNLKMRILKKYRFDMYDDMTPQKCVERISDAIQLMISRSFIQKEMVLGLGVGTVGPMDRQSGILLHPQGFPDVAWDDEIPLKHLLQVATGIPCEIDNGANTAALAEYQFGTGRGHQNVVYVHCGVGIRSAIIREGTIIRTMNDCEDALAHMTIDINENSSCSCGSKGCLENYVSLKSIQSQLLSVTRERIDYKKLFSDAAEGNRSTTDAFNKSAETLGVGLSNLSRIVNPDLIILSGPLVSNFEPYYGACIRSFCERNGNSSSPVFSKEGTFKEDVVAIGAGLMIPEQQINQKG